MITTLLTNWGQAWGMAGISVGVVFTILVLLVVVLYFFSKVAAGKAAKAEESAKPKVLTGAEYIKSKQAKLADASDADVIALATAIYLYTANQHDEESGLLTIHHTDHTAWHAELNEHL